MGEPRSSQRRPSVPSRDSSVTKVLSHLISESGSSAASGEDNQATVISKRAGGSESSAPLLAALEAGKLLEGEQLGQFELKKFVGGGGMGVVFRAWDTTLNREVAVKVLSRDQSADDETLRRFRNEAQSAARLDHGNIARVYFVGEDRGVHYIVFEFIEGVNLRDLVDRHGPLPVDEAVEFTVQIAEALDHASQRDVIHRDIKPSNVLITEDGLAKLVDMGLARLHQVEHTNDDLTASGVTLGTFDYISPEQARDPRSADVRSDLYSLGCSLYFMLLGRPPFPNGTVLQKLLQHQGEEPTDPRMLRSDLPTDLLKILHKLLAKSPLERYQSPQELIEDLNALKAHRPLLAGASDVSWGAAEASGAGAWQRHIPWAIPLIGLIAVCATLEVYWRNESRLEDSFALPLSEFGTTSNLTASPNSRGSATTALPKDNATDSAPIASIPPVLNGKQADSPNTVHNKLTRSAKAMSLSGAESDSGGARYRDKLKETKRLGENVLVVSDSGLPDTYATLKAASNAAQNGDIIELRYNGRKMEEPFQVANSNLTIRAAENYSPIITFRPAEISHGVDEHAMVSISGGSLTVMNVAIEMVVPTDALPDKWALFEAHEVESLRFVNSILTIYNDSAGGFAFHPHVYFLDVVPSITLKAVVPLLTDISPEPMASSVAIELQNCIARGEASFLHIEGGASAQVVWNNGLLVTSERMIHARGSAEGDHPARLAFSGRHLTVDTGRGLASIDFTSNSQDGLFVDLMMAGSILIGNSASPLIDQIVTETELIPGGPFHWSGDRNFYEGFEVFWKRGETADTDLAQRIGFSDWRRFWGQTREMLPYLNEVEWKTTGPRTLPVSQRVPAHYQLSDSLSSNLAKNSADDGLDAGCLQEKLPQLTIQADK